MDPRRVLTFRAVAHHRSFSRAARTLALSQPSVSNQVSALERELGARLLEREPGRLRLTPRAPILLRADAIAEHFQLRGHPDRRRARRGVGRASAPCRPRSPARCPRHRAPARAPPRRQGQRRRGRRRPARPRAHRRAASRAALPRTRRTHATCRPELSGASCAERFSWSRCRPATGSTSPTVLHRRPRSDWTAALSDGLIVRTCRASPASPPTWSRSRTTVSQSHPDPPLSPSPSPPTCTSAFDGIALRPITSPAPRRLRPGRTAPACASRAILDAFRPPPSSKGARPPSGSSARSSRSPCSGRSGPRSRSGSPRRSGPGCGPAAPRAVSIMPGVQNPHCSPCFSWKPCWTGSSTPSRSRPFDGRDLVALGGRGQHRARTSPARRPSARRRSRSWRCRSPSGSRSAERRRAGSARAAGAARRRACAHCPLTETVTCIYGRAVIRRTDPTYSGCERRRRRA